ncbi:hypothetical protein ACPEEZ_01685 [Frigoribacterium sp. 2-23]|uniref:hypothetical protein n=1 Tax=Frigoribacterium sp. 2-23 TaxID=3415006 RepID=UPI003C701921
MSAHRQTRYQVRFDWGEGGAARVADGAHVVVVVDQLDGHGSSSTRAAVERIARHAPAGASVLHATTASAADAARYVLDAQAARGDRAIVAIVAVGADDPTGFRPCVEDLLAAGAVVDALAARGIDFSSPEAAAACAAAVSLQKAAGHLLTASSSAAEVTEAGGTVATIADRSPQVDVIREFSVTA